MTFIKHLREFEENSDTALKPMPSFLKNTSAKPKYVHRGGEMPESPKPNAWVMGVKSPNPIFGERVEIEFYPDRTWILRAHPSSGKALMSEGGWVEQTGTASLAGTEFGGVGFTLKNLLKPYTETLGY